MSFKIYNIIRGGAKVLRGGAENFRRGHKVIPGEVQSHPRGGAHLPPKSSLDPTLYGLKALQYYRGFHKT